MLKVTEPAYSRLFEMLAEYPENVGVRILRRRGRLKLRPGRRRPGDKVFERSGRPVLLIDDETSDRLTERTLDARSTENGMRLRLRSASPQSERS